MLKHGPVDVIVLAFGEPRLEGKILAELERQVAAGLIQVLDAMVLYKDEEGTRRRLNIEELPAEDTASLGYIPTGTRGLFDTEDAETLFEGMHPGSAVVALAIEHVWAVALVNSMVDSGAELALHFRVPAPVIDDAYAALAVSK